MFLTHVRGTWKGIKLFPQIIVWLGIKAALTLQRSYVTETRGTLSERNCAAASYKKYVTVVSDVGDRELP